MKKTINIYTLGCKVNQYDSGSIIKEFTEAGFSLVKKDAYLSVINTCAVTMSAISKCKKMVQKAKKENPGCKVAIVGCWPKIYKEETNKYSADYIFTSKDFNSLVKLVGGGSPTSCGILSNRTISSKSRYFIKIQDGCRQFCSYCIIPYARGKLKSRTEKEVLEEINEAVKKGYKEFVLSGIHLGLYGVDLPKKTDLVNLVSKIIKIQNFGRLRLSSIEPNEVSTKLISLIKRSNKICNNLHIPLQSGTDKILSLMNRPYDTNKFASKINQIKKEIPDIAISTDVIVGFPGEKDDDFTETIEFIKKMNFSRLHIFSFSAHEKTPAYSMPGKVSLPRIKARSKTLRLLGDKMEKEFILTTCKKSSSLDVIIEKIDKCSITGKSEYYFDIDKKMSASKLKSLRAGDLITVEV